MTQERAQKRRETIHLEIDRDETHIFSKVDYAKEAQRVLGGDVVQYTEIRENETVIEKELLSEMIWHLEHNEFWKYERWEVLVNKLKALK